MAFLTFLYKIDIEDFKKFQCLQINQCYTTNRDIPKFRLVSSEVPYFRTKD